MDKFQYVQSLALQHPDYYYCEGVCAISDRIEFQFHCWLLDPDGQIADPIHGALPDPIYIGNIVEPNKDGTPVYSEAEAFELLQVASNVPSKEAW